MKNAPPLFLLPGVQRIFGGFSLSKCRGDLQWLKGVLAVDLARSTCGCAFRRDPFGMTMTIQNQADNRVNAGEPVNAGETLWDRGRLEAVHTQADKSQRVRQMFDSIAPTYERINTLFSGGRDRAWRKRTVKIAGVQQGDSVLDIACGTGDLLRAFDAGAVRPSRLTGADFSLGMLRHAVNSDAPTASWLQADGLSLPFASESFDITSCAFGVRNFQDLNAGLREMHRVLRPGGRAVILEFTRPANRVVRFVHEFYSARLMPLGARILSRDRTGAYSYLPKSVVSFVDASAMCRRLKAAGFAKATATPLTFGVVTVYRADKVAT